MKPFQPDWNIRPFEPGDIQAALDLWAASEGLGVGPGDTLPELSRYLERNPGISQVAIAGQTLVAAMLCGHDGRRAYIYRLAVAASHRRQGLASALVQACLEALRAADIPRCQVFVLADNAVAAGFWARMGGRPRGELRMLSIEL